MKKIVFLLIFLSLEVNSFAGDQKYVPPIGIPAPPFGINETYRMYDYEPNQNPALTYYPSDSGGYYTHYIDSTDANSTDSSNPYGTKAKPRKTIPRYTNAPIAGSIVEIHATTTNTSSWGLCVGGVGTTDMPIFYRGVGEPNVGASLHIGYYDTAQYIIVEGILCRGGSISSARADWYGDFDNNHIAIRNCDIGECDTLVGAGMAINGYNGNWLESVVIYNNEIHDFGPWDTNEGDPDNHGIGVNKYVRYLWILDNTMYHCAGNAVQVTGNGPLDDETLCHHIYLGGNTNNGLPNLQCFIAIKSAMDVIVSQNHIWGQGGYRTNSGLGYQYGPERVWLLFNTIHDLNGGIGCGSDSVANPGLEHYIIGNLIYNIVQKEGAEWNGNSWSNAGMMISSGVNRYIIGNTIYNATAGIYSPGGGTFHIYNNIISNVTHENGKHLLITSGTSEISVQNNIFYQPGADVALDWHSAVGDVAEFESESGGSASGNVELDPLFVDAAKCNFNLQETSPVKNLETSEQVQAVYERFLQLYGIDLAADIDGVPRTAPTIVLPEPEDTSDSDDSGTDVNTDTGSDDTGTVIPETPSVPAADTGSSNTTGTTGSVSTPKISPLPMPLADTSTAETSSSNNTSTAEYSAISILYSATSSGLHVDGSKDSKIRTIKVGRIFQRYDDIYCPPNKNSKSSAIYE